MRKPAAILPVTCAVVLAACGGIPASGSPQPADVPAADALAVRPIFGDRPPPQPGATPREIVEGFFSAMEQYASHSIARQYLTGDADDAWEPLREIVIFTGDPDIEINEGVATVEVMIEASYDRMDGFVRHPTGSTDRFTFAVEQVDDEWRLAETPEGLLISSDRFASDFEPHNLYFYDKSFQRLVPEPVYLPRTAINQETLLVEALLAGPSQRLARAVDTAIPDGTSLVSVPLSGTSSARREVKLSEDAVRLDNRAISAETRDQIVDQVVSTLGELRSVDAVAVTAGGTRLSGTDDDPFVDVEDIGTLGPDDQLYAVTDAGVVEVDSPDDMAAVRGPLASYPGLREVAVDQAHAQAAVITSDYDLEVTSLRSTETEIRPVLPGGGDFESPAWDSSGLLWAIERPRGTAGDGEGATGEGEDEGATSDGQDRAEPDLDGEAESKGGDVGDRLLVIHPSTEESHAVDLHAEDGAAVDEFAISPDGTRIAVVIGGNVHLGIIVRDSERPQDPSAVSVEGLRQVHFEYLSEPVGDLDWYGSDALALLTAPEPVGTEELELGSGEPAPPVRSDPRAYVAPLSLLRVLDGRVIEGGESITAPISEARLAVGTRDGSVLIRSETARWEPFEGISAPAFSG